MRDEESGIGHWSEPGSRARDLPPARQAAAFVTGELGRLDALINNAAIAIDPDASLETVDLDVMRRTLETNLLGVLGCCQAFLPLMRRQEYGRIVNVSSGRGSFSRL